MKVSGNKTITEKVEVDINPIDVIEELYNSYKRTCGFGKDDYIREDDDGVSYWYEARGYNGHTGDIIYRKGRAARMQETGMYFSYKQFIQLAKEV